MNMATLHRTSLQRRLILLEGAVQGVGFRPFVYRLGVELGLSGFVCNSSDGLTIEIQGPSDRLDDFILRLKNESPPNAVIEKIHISGLLLQEDHKFMIRDSQSALSPQAFILPDLATCPLCLEEIMNPEDRRFEYPFTNCTHCGPRYSIIEQLPYDRKNTSMKKFVMCPECQREYDDPDDRRFHAQPNACPLCGPQLQLWEPQGKVLAKGNDALSLAVEALGSGRILAVKGLGGFQLMADARQQEAVCLLRERKHRSQKPFALMFPSLESVRNYCVVSSIEERALLSAQAPIVLCVKRNKALQGDDISFAVSFDNPYWGAMLPYTPLHFLLMRKFGSPIVATSANLSEEPMCIDNDEALNKLGMIADVFLVHDRPIVRPVDDSVGMAINGRFSLTRRARGYAPLPVLVDDSETAGLALGAQMKNTVALKIRDKVFLSQHIGDLQCAESLSVFIQSIKSLRGLYPHPLDYVAADLHPDYLSTRYAQGLKEPVVFVQHHHAHVASCMAEHQLRGPVLGLAWDGTGLGEANVIWGSEFLVSTCLDFDRVAHLLPFRLPGGDSAIRQPKRTALGLLGALCDNDLQRFNDLSIMKLFSQSELENIPKILGSAKGSVPTTSMGRLFDGVSALLGLCQESTFEGQAAMRLEHVMGTQMVLGHYHWTAIEQKAPFSKEVEGTKYVLDWRPMLLEILNAIRASEPSFSIAAKFHNTLVEMALDVARRVALPQVVLSGGCFQNKYLSERLISRLKEEGFDVYWHSQVPANDGGISLGQAVIASACWKNKKGANPCV